MGISGIFFQGVLMPIILPLQELAPTALTPGGMKPFLH